MTTVIYGITGRDGKPGLAFFNSLGGAEVGGWCDTNHKPDRCDSCFDSDTMLHQKAVGYRMEKDSHGKVWRHGVCEKCAGEYKHVHLYKEGEIA